MANILYGVNGEGAGNSTRAKEILSHLVAQGHTVHVASFDRGRQNLKQNFDVTEIYGFRFAYVNNRVRYKRTIAKNLITVPQAAHSLSRLKDLVEEWKTDLIITDFEPLTCHVGHKKRLPVISIDNQHCLTNTVVSYPRKYRGDAAAAKLVTRLMTPHANAYLVISFFTAPIRKRNTFLFPPLLRQAILDASPTEGDHVLVYVTSPSPALVKLLASVRCHFIAYGFGREGVEGNILYKKPSVDGFFADLTSARAIVANSGFSLVTECPASGQALLGRPGQPSVRTDLQRILAGEVRLRRVLGRLEQRASRLFPLQSAALSRSPGTISPTRQRSPPGKARYPHLPTGVESSKFAASEV